jgi:large subunit ribosomal protein L1
MLGGLKKPLLPQKGFTRIMAKKSEIITAPEAELMEKPEAEVMVVEDAKEVKLAKAGKKSAKAIAEAEAKAEKEARKAANDTTPQSEDAEAHSKKGPKPITRPLIERRGKSYRKMAELVDKSKTYSLTDGMELISKTNPSKFDASVELHVRLGVDPRQADQNIRATVSLPNGTGKTIRVAVFAPETEHAAATKAGADIVGDETLLQQLDKGIVNFDILVATPQYMPKLGKYARLLGPKGLMPNPKSGTVAVNVAKAVTEAKAGKVEYRVDKQSIVHLSIGKVSFGTNKLEQNATAFFDSLKAHKPTSLKGQFVKSISTSTTQGPSIKIENNIN